MNLFFPGGNPYKIEGDDAYKEIVQYILRKYKSMHFVYASNGTNRALEALKKEFPDRFFRIEERKDLDAILNRAKFYLSTYPISGALMSQYAIQNKCIPLTLCDEKVGATDLKTWMLNPENVNFVYYKKENLISEIDLLICDEKYYLDKKIILASK